MSPSTKKLLALPFRPIASPSAVWMAAAVGAKGIQLLKAVLLPQGPGNHGGSIAWAVVDIACAYVATRFAMRARKRRDAVAYVAAGALASMLIGGGTRLMASGLMAPFRAAAQHYPIAAGLVAALMLGVVLTLLAIWEAILAFVLYPLVRSPSHENSDRALTAAALWVAIPHAAFGLLWLFGYGAHVPFWTKASDFVLLVGLPGALALLGACRIRRRREWLRLVDEGKVSGWRLVDSDTQAPVQLPIVAADGGPTERVLARIPDADEPFRSLELERVASVGGRPR